MITANSCRCCKCKKLLSYEERIKITTYNHVKDPQCSGSRGRTIDNFNLCEPCYQEYRKYTFLFFK